MSPDETAIRAVITECYAMISGPAGPRDWSRQDAIFHPDCRQMRTSLDENGRSKVEILDLDDYEKSAGEALMTMAFHEIELDVRIDVFGNMAQAWSLYEAKHHPDDETPERRGINAIHFFKDGDGAWKIISMIWDNERDGLALPTL
jgi:hypothetical protein